MLIIDLTFYEVIGFNRVLFDEVWSIRYLVYKWWLYSLKNKMYMYLIYIIELRRKPLFSSLPTNNALDNWTLFIILRILRISNA